MFLNKLQSKLTSLLAENKSVIISEAAADLQKIVAINCFLSQKVDTIIVCENLEEAQNLFNLAKNTFKIDNTFYFPDFNLEPYSKASSNKIVSQTRIDTLYSLINNKGVKLLITTTLAFIYKTVTKKYLQNKQLSITVGQKFSIEKIINFLILSGYNRRDKVTYQGEFALRGDILDIYSTSSAPVRISFFDNLIESIKTFDIISQRTQNNLTTYTINLPLELTLTAESIDNFKNSYQNTFYKTASLVKSSLEDPNLELINSGRLPLGAEHYFQLFFNDSAAVYSYLNNPLIVFINNSLLEVDNLWQLYSDSYVARVNSNSFSNQKYQLLPPEKLLLSKQEVTTLLKSYSNVTINSSAYPENTGKLKIVALTSKSVTFLFSGKLNINEKGKALVKLIKQNNNSIFLLNFISPNAVKFITNLLVENNIHYALVEDLNKLSNKHRKDSQVLLSKDSSLKQGFMWDNIAVICESDFFSNHTFAANTNKVKTNKKFPAVHELQPGELLVHLKHGIGKYIGLVTLSNQGVEHDFLALEYQNGDKLYLPVENIDLLSKYGSQNERTGLDKLGSNAWEKRKAAIKEKLQEIAYDLIKLAAVRNLRKGPKINPNPENYLEFSNAFPYIETEDQLKAIEDIRNDFRNNKVIDRLICGDVGFGKTEVAMRAAFLAAEAGYQVAIIAPTTLLVRQHYYNFLKRFKGYNFAIRQLSRFVSVKEKKIIKEDLKEGKVSIVIATHALLAKDVVFNNLGLLIIDEEQNFGVIHKEKIKTLKDNIHTINLTATPIPRTLQMALTGIKELSIIATPPINKLPIKSYVMPFDKLIIKEAILREINRGGQIFFVAPFIKELEELQRFLLSLKLNLSTLILHGQMQTEQIENHMRDFQDNKYNVLLSTNIIESGIDLDNVNTIIISNADKFGLAQLYQLRGRVGRGKTQSFAYITYKNLHLLTSDAKKRLDAIQNLDYLGAGFTLAEHDLDIRGAGNILGKEQSGHIKGIGIELYNKFLAEEINTLKQKGSNSVSYDSLSPNVILQVAALLPGSYINSIATRMEFYQKLANASSFAEVELIVNELIDRFGKLPLETENLITLIKLKILSKNLGIEKLVVGSKGVVLYFYQNKPLNAEALLLYIQQNAAMVKLQKDLSLFANFNSDTKESQIKEVLTLLFVLKNIFKPY